MLFSFVKTSHITEPYRVAAWVCIGATALARRVSALAFRLMISARRGDRSCFYPLRCRAPDVP